MEIELTNTKNPTQRQENILQDIKLVPKLNASALERRLGHYENQLVPETWGLACDNLPNQPACKEPRPLVSPAAPECLKLR